MDVEDVYAKNKDIKKDHVKTLQEWAKKQPHLPTITELQFVTFLHSCYFNIEMAKTTIENFYTYRAHCPEFFTNLNFNAVSKTLDLIFFSLLPKLTPEGYHVVFSKLSPDSSNYVFSQHVKVLLMSLAAFFERQGPSEGLVIVQDFKEFTFGHLVKAPILEVKKLMMYLQEALPVRLKAIYIINIGGVIDSAMAIVKPFLKKELAQSVSERIFIDRSFKKNFSFSFLTETTKKCLIKFQESAYQKTMEAKWNLSKSFVVPEISEIFKRNADILVSENAIKLFKDESEFFSEHEKLFADESKRLGKVTNVDDLFGVEGSFKKLSID
ncbi:hypothetical protein FQA39_LY19131 [Lamprigera yunnana]|nr:hypothetical protein FQA39_LY19131 [Lamprigera yunnana]